MTQISFDQLRTLHPRIVYEGFEITHRKSALKISYDFVLEPNIRFRPTLEIAGIPRRGELDLKAIEGLVFNIGLVELISYWKAACPREIIIRAGALDAYQTDWWKDLYIHGLGEFFFTNGIDISDPTLLSFKSESDRHFEPFDASQHEGDLILVAGGKDSSLSLELLKDRTGGRAMPLCLNPTRAALGSVSVAGYQQTCQVSRTIDKKLLSLNREGYLNGHTPFSACLAFCSALVGSLFGYKHLIVSNEHSANEASEVLNGIPINHQYSKGFRFETKFREYTPRYLANGLNYFSFLRPLCDLQISRMFSGYAGQLKSFRSCNVNQKKDSWCCQCPKCAFVYLSLFPFVEETELHSIFGGDLFTSPEVNAQIESLVGLGERKPFDCVGTIEECRAALALVARKLKLRNQPLPLPLEALLTRLGSNALSVSDAEKVLSSWNNEHYLPPEHEVLLHGAIDALPPIPVTGQIIPKPKLEKASTGSKTDITVRRG